MKINQLVFVTIVALFALPNTAIFAQQVTVGSPFRTVTDDYYERVGVNFGFTIPGSPNYAGGDRARGVFGLTPTGQINPNGIQFTQNSAAATIPAIGGFDPNAGAQLGFAVRNGDGGGFNLNFFGSKGSSRSLTSTTPSVTSMNGVPGSIFSGTQRPFVTGIIPVVGEGSISPIDVALQRMRERGETLDSLRMQAEEERRADEAARQQQAGRIASSEVSSATQGALSLDEIRRLKAAQKSDNSDEIDQLLEKVDLAEEEGRFGTARTFLNQAIRKSSGERRVALQQRYAQLKNRR